MISWIPTITGLLMGISYRWLLANESNRSSVTKHAERKEKLL